MGKEDEMHGRTVSRRKEAANPMKEVREEPWFGRKRAAKRRERYVLRGERERVGTEGRFRKS
jgi:hypothetical protein